MDKYLFTSESVSEGHPDKVADKISDYVLDLFLKEDKNAKVACETLLTANHIIVAGEITSTAKESIDENVIKETVLKTISDIGYTDEFYYKPDEIKFQLLIQNQAGEINNLVERNKNAGDQGAGDQGLMFGYATKETPELMPVPISIAHKLLLKLKEIRNNKTVDWLGPDAKSQACIEYSDAGFSVDSITISTQHKKEIGLDDLRKYISENVIKEVIKDYNKTEKYNEHINRLGTFIEGGPKADTGLTGRKIIVDTYGGSCPHGGGAFSGKDPSKVDRSAAYMCRYIAKNIVAAGIAVKCLVQISYVIGFNDQISFMLDFYNTGKLKESEVVNKILNEKIFDLSPAGIIKMLDLKRPIYSKTTNYGHFGRDDKDFLWEKTDKANDLKTIFKIN